MEDDDVSGDKKYFCFYFEFTKIFFFFFSIANFFWQNVFFFIFYSKRILSFVLLKIRWWSWGLDFWKFSLYVFCASGWVIAIIIGGLLHSFLPSIHSTQFFSLPLRLIFWSFQLFNWQNSKVKEKDARTSKEKMFSCWNGRRRKKKNARSETK